MEANRPPQVVVLAGVNGAGKSTASQRSLRDALKIPVFVNADTIARGLNAFDVESEAVAAGRIMLDHLHKLASSKRSFASETTLAAEHTPSGSANSASRGTPSISSITG